MKAYGENGGVEVIIRGCTWGPSSAAGQCEKGSEQGVSVEVCACDTDKCNSAKAIALNVGLVLVGAAVALFKF